MHSVPCHACCANYVGKQLISCTESVLTQSSVLAHMVHKSAMG